MKHKSPEHDEQVAFFDWVRIKENSDERYKAIFAIPNGGHRHVATAMRLKAEGVRAGVLDVLCAVPRNGWSGLWIEFKIKPNRLSKDQKAFGQLMHSFGFRVTVAWNAAQGIEYVTNYLED